MKFSYCLLTAFCIAAIYSCADKEVQAPQVNSKVLAGVWEYRTHVGGMVPVTSDDGKPGNGEIWAFTNTDFQFIYKDSVYRSGIYSVSQGTGTDLNTGRTIDQFIFNNVSSESFELRNDTLRFYHGATPYDGDIEMYVKIADDTTGYSLH